MASNATIPSNILILIIPYFNEIAYLIVNMYNKMSAGRCLV